ncbi:iron-sulfur cluster assembly scaffold protein [Povalibacter sp.]|uniref:iron-sulfur cluster assembly scaffold protein n=1 Tax=Povalibacter sp. TaxID=1962978 RepID=UPI002F405349
MGVPVVSRYSPLVVDHFEHPRNTGCFDPAADVIEARAGSTGQGALFQFSARIAAGALAEVRFQVYGCPHCVAAASWLSERLSNATLDDLASWSWREAADALDVPAEKRGRLLILEDAVRRLAEAWRSRR